MTSYSITIVRHSVNRGKMSLKRRHSQSTVHEKLIAVESLVVEDVNRDTINAAVSIIKKLNAIDLRSLPTLDQAREAAVAAATDAFNAGDSQTLMQKITGLFKEKRSPFLDSLAFAAALRSLFPTLEKFASAVTAKVGQDVDESLSLNQLVTDDRMYDALKNVIKGGFRPDGRLAQVGNTWRKRFVAASDDAIADEILEIPLETLRDVARSVSTAVSGVSKLSTSLPTASEPASKTISTDDKIGKNVQNAINKIKAHGLEVEPRAVELTVKALADLGLLK